MLMAGWKSLTKPHAFEARVPSVSGRPNVTGMGMPRMSSSTVALFPGSVRYNSSSTRSRTDIRFRRGRTRLSRSSPPASADASGDSRSSRALELLSPYCIILPRRDVVHAESRPI